MPEKGVNEQRQRERAIDAGPLSRARQLEAMGFLSITLQGPLGTHFKSTWKLLFP